MKTKLIKLSLCSCALAMCLSSTLYAQALLNVKIGETANDYTGGVGGGGPELNGAYQEVAAAVLGSGNSWWNEYAYVASTPFQVSVVDSGDNAMSGVTLTVANSTGVGSKTTAGTNPNFLFNNQPYQAVGGVFTITLAGLAANTEYEFVGYASRTSSGAGASWAVTTGTLNSGTTLNDGTSMDITTGVGKSYSEFFATTDGSGNLAVTDSGNPGTAITVLAGFQLEAVVVPEPSTIVLTLTALGLLAGKTLIRRQQNA